MDREWDAWGTVRGRQVSAGRCQTRAYDENTRARVPASAPGNLGSRVAGVIRARGR
jgi:hypothetical protein